MSEKTEITHYQSLNKALELNMAFRDYLLYLILKSYTTPVLPEGSATSALQVTGNSILSNINNNLKDGISVAQIATKIFNSSDSIDGKLTFDETSLAELMHDNIVLLESCLKNIDNPKGFINTIDVLYQSYLKLNSLNSKDFATQTTLALIKTAIDSINAKDFATSTKQDTGNTSLSTIAGKDFATQTTLALIKTAIDSINAKDFATQTTLALIKTKTDNVDVALSTGLNTLAKNVSAPQLITGATNVLISALASTADGILYSVTGGKTFYMSDLAITASAVALGQVHIRDGAGGNILYTFRVPVSSGVTMVPINYNKPKQITSSLYIDFISGTSVSVDITAGGIEI